MPSPGSYARHDPQEVEFVRMIESDFLRRSTTNGTQVGSSPVEDEELGKQHSEERKCEDKVLVGPKGARARDPDEARVKERSMESAKKK